MSKAPTNILRLPGVEHDTCSICGQYGQLVGRDRTTGLCCCQNCLLPLCSVDHALTLVGPKVGICHPSPAIPPQP
jgi:hypothetical protein